MKHPLAKGPVLDEYGTLTDPEQLRVVVRMLSKQLENFAKNPMRLLDPKQNNAVYHQAITLHNATCPDCAEERKAGRVPAEDVEQDRLTLEASFLVYIRADEELQKQRAEDMLLLSPAEHKLMQALGAGPTLGTNPLSN